MAVWAEGSRLPHLGLKLACLDDVGAEAEQRNKKRSYDFCRGPPLCHLPLLLPPSPAPVLQQSAPFLLQGGHCLKGEKGRDFA